MIQNENKSFIFVFEDEKENLDSGKLWYVIKSISSYH